MTQLWLLCLNPLADPSCCSCVRGGKATLCDRLGVYIAQEPASHSVIRQLKILPLSTWSSTHFSLQRLHFPFPEIPSPIPGIHVGRPQRRQLILSWLGSCTWDLGCVLWSGTVRGVHYSRNLFVPPSPIFTLSSSFCPFMNDVNITGGMPYSILLSFLDGCSLWLSRGYSSCHNVRGIK